MTREQLLENALNTAMKSLATYGSHPIIEQKAEKAINPKIPAIMWWNTLDFDKKFFKVIEWLSDKGEDTDSIHPDRITDEELVELFFHHH